MVAEGNEGAEAAGAEKPKGLLGRVFGQGGKNYKAAKMGKTLEMYYNDEVRFKNGTTATQILNFIHHLPKNLHCNADSNFSFHCSSNAGYYRAKRRRKRRK